MNNEKKQEILDKEFNDFKKRIDKVLEMFVEEYVHRFSNEYGIELMDVVGKLISESKLNDKDVNKIKKDKKKEKKSKDWKGEVVNEIYNNAEKTLNEAEGKLLEDAEKFWNKTEKEFREYLIVIATKINYLPKEENDRLKDIIRNFRHISLDAIPSDSFSKEEFIKSIKFFGFSLISILNKKELLKRHNDSLEKKISVFSQKMTDVHTRNFRKWADELYGALNIREINPELYTKRQELKNLWK